MAFPHILDPEAAQVWSLSQQLGRFERLAPTEQLSIQTQSLRVLFTWATEHSRFWGERLATVGWNTSADPWQALASLPPLTRADLQENFATLSCDAALPASSCADAHSTGTTGRPVRTQKHRQPFRLRYMAQALRCTLWHQLDASQSIMKFSVRIEDGVQMNWGAPEAWFAKTGPLFLVTSVGRDVAALYAQLKQHRPGHIVADGSVVGALAKYALTHDAGELPRIPTILTTGEVVTEALRRDCAAAFGARIINRYTCEEIGWLAIQCPTHHHLHVMAANVIVDIVDEAGRPCPVGQPGRVLVTALHSEAMPLIRYDVGDMAEWGEPCDCGITMPVLRRIWGRQREFFRTPTGELRHIVILAEHFLAIAPIRDMRFRHYSNPLLRFEVVCDTPLTEPQRAALTAEVQTMLGCDCLVEIEQRQAISWGLTDKRITFLAMDVPWSPQ